MKKLVAMLLCLAMVLGMTACGAKTEAPVEAPTHPTTYEELDQVQEGVEDVDFEDTTIQYKEHIVIGSDAALVTLDPHSTPSTPTADYTMLVYDRLINYDELKMEFQPELATEWTWVDDVTLEQASEALGVPIYPTEADGFMLCDAIFGILPELPEPVRNSTGEKYYQYNQNN